MEHFVAPYVLMVDDDEDDRSLFAETFAHAAPLAKLHQLSSGAALIQHLKKNPLPEMIFLDLNMPCISGFECLMHIRSDSTLSNIPVIIYTTSMAYIDIEEAFHKGATFFLPKPANLSCLAKAIQHLYTLNLKTHQTNKSDFVLTFQSRQKVHKSYL